MKVIRHAVGSVLVLIGLFVSHNHVAGAAVPNIVVIVADDLGYADVLFNPRHAKEVNTPHLAALARESVICRQGYVTGNVCSPTRTALMTGRYQQRLGLYTAGEAGSGVPMNEKLFPQFLKPAGYTSIQIGKWHLGPTPQWSPALRGFDEVFGFLGRGAHDYFKLDDPDDPIYRGTTPVKLSGYLTDHWGDEAAAFAERNKDKRFFLYLAFNAVHAPLQAPDDEVAKFDTGNANRNTLLAMGKRMDDAVGKLVGQLKRDGNWENTLLFFISDNGGPLAQTANNTPLRGGKHMDYEGGVRVPFLVCWPKKLKPGESQAVVSALDILPTSLAAAGLTAPTNKRLDGINLLPVLTGELPAPKRNLFWSSASNEGWWAVRSGDFKLVAQRARVELFDLAKDVSEKNDLAKAKPDQLAELTRLHDEWLAQMADPVKSGTKKWIPGTSAEPAKKKKLTPEQKKKAREDERAKQKKPVDQSAVKLKPNVLLIAVDDLRDTLGCYGNTAVKTPNIDRLAARGIVFQRAYVQYPVCNASRSSFLTGLRPDQTGVTDNATLLRDKLPDVVTFPQLLKGNGWHSAAFGKIFHLGGGRHAELKSKWMDLPKSWHTAEAFQATPTGTQKLAGRNLTEGKLNWCHWGMMDGGDDDQPDGQIASAVIARIERLGDQPWIIGAGFMKPHDPFVAPKKYFDLYPDGSFELYRDPEDRTPAPPLAVGFGAFGEAFGNFTDADRMEFLRAYYACTSFMDAQVGRVLDTLDRHKLWDRTLVIFVGDHGYHLGERNWWNKNTLFDRSCRAPLIIAAPGVKPGVARGLVEFVDLYPTIAEQCGLEAPAGIAGRSLRPLLSNPAAAGKDAAFTIVTRGPKQRGESIRTDRWRYTEWSDGERELYDHADDSQETRNVAAANAEVVQELSLRLAESRSGREVND